MTGAEGGGYQAYWECISLHYFLCNFAGTAYRVFVLAVWTLCWLLDCCVDDTVGGMVSMSLARVAFNACGLGRVGT